MNYTYNMILYCVEKEISRVDYATIYSREEKQYVK